MLALLALACAAAPDPGPPAARAAEVGSAAPKDAAGCEAAPLVTWESWGQGFFLTWCTSCHSAYTADRRGAPAGVDFDTAAEVERWSERIHARVIDEQTMPVGGGVYPDQVELLKVLLACGP